MSQSLFTTYWPSKPITMNFKFILPLTFVIFMLACKNEPQSNNQEAAAKATSTTETPELNKADEIVKDAIATHGGKNYDTAYYAFTFRKKRYSFRNTSGSYVYTMTEEKPKETIIDSLTKKGLTRHINGTSMELSQKDHFKYTEALNSVIYFATLPHKLKDEAVQKEYLGQTTIKDQTYDIVKVSFAQKGGGVDFEDVFLYWFHTDRKTMDYLAYEYHTNTGGIRFRSAYNTRTIDGIIFQDFINYKAKLGTDLKQLPTLYEKGKLEELSKIEVEDVVHLRAK